jgi:arylsulfatase A-like enzyme
MTRQAPRRIPLLLLALTVLGTIFAGAETGTRKPNILFVMADDMGWGQTSYRNHPLLKTPHLDAMAANGLRFERFYSGGPVCSPTRASVLTGRSPDRTGVLNHGYALRLQEKTLAQALQAAGYVTGHFGKLHLTGHSGSGVPILASDSHHPGVLGFDEWISVTNYFDTDPLMSRSGAIEEFKGDSSEVIVTQAVEFLKKHRNSGKPLFATIWYGSPHSPFHASASDVAPFSSLEETSANHYGELVAMDRSIGTLRQQLIELGLAQNTLLVFCSDNGGLPKITPETVGGLRGNKGSLFEGGIRVPGIIEWPGTIQPRITRYPASVMDLFPTMADLVGLPENSMLKPIDGISLKPLFTQDLNERKSPIGFRYLTQLAWVADQYKLVTQNSAGGKFQLYDLSKDAGEKKDLSAELPDVARQMKAQLLEWNSSVEASFSGKDYPAGKVTPLDLKPIPWTESAAYRPYLDAWYAHDSLKSDIDRSRGKSSKKDSAD